MWGRIGRFSGRETARVEQGSVMFVKTRIKKVDPVFRKETHGSRGPEVNNGEGRRWARAADEVDVGVVPA